MTITTAIELFVQIELPEADARELDQLSRQLQSQIRELNVESIDMLRTDTAPDGTKAVGAIAWDQIAVQLAPVVIPPLFDLVEAWMSRHPNKTLKIKIKVGRRTGELEYDPLTTSPRELQKLVDVLTQSLSKSR